MGLEFKIYVYFSGKHQQIFVCAITLILFQYFAPIVIIWSAQLTFLIVLPVVRGPLYSWLARLATLSIELYNEPGEEGEGDTNLVTFVWNVMMVHLECCGVNSYQDFQQSPHWSAARQKLQVIISGQS